jgi:hypothetical protein
VSHPAGGKQATPKDGWVGLASQGRGDERVLGRLSRRLKGTHTRPLNVCMPREGGDGPRNPCHFLVEAFSKGIFGHQANAQDKGKRKRTGGLIREHMTGMNTY